MKQDKQTETRSPIKVKPLRAPGQSLDEQRQRLIDEDIGGYVWVSVAMIVFVALEWVREWFGWELQPVPLTLVAVAVIAYSVYRSRQLGRYARDLRLGSEGEKAVGQLLDELRANGYRVFHDIPGEGFNIDHVVVAPQGIFLIETKTRSKPVGRDARVTFDGKRVLVDGYEAERDPVEQVKDSRRWLAGKLEETTGKKLPMRAVILFPGWWVKFEPSTLDGPVWVMNPKVLPGRIAKLREVMSRPDMELAASHLAALIRMLG